MLIPALLTSAFALVILVVVGVLTRMAARPVWVLASGTVPPAGTWMEPALRALAVEVSGRYSWTDDEIGALLNGHTGEVRTGDQSTKIIASLQPHPAAAEVPRSSPVRVALVLADFTPRPGLPRLMLGHVPLPSALRFRRRAQILISNQLRDAGAAASSTSRPSPALVLASGLVVLLAAAVALLGPPIATALGPDAPVPSPRPRPPAATVVCKTSGASTRPPTRSAAQTAARCALAEKARAAYLAKATRPQTVELGKVQDPTTKQRYTFTCQGTDLIVCSKDKLRIYLFTP